MDIAFASVNTYPVAKEYIKAQGCLLVEVPPLKTTYTAADAHADLYFHPLAGKPPQLFYVPPAEPLLAPLRQILPENAFDRRPTAGPQSANYPGNIALNAVSTCQFFIHNLQHTDPQLKQAAEASGLTMVHVKQGYTKCNVVVVAEDAFITADQGIAKALAAYPCAVLTITPGHVALPGLSTGFLGGASGHLSGELIFNGDLRQHPDFTRIGEFCRIHGRKIRWFDDIPLLDIGSIVTFSLSTL